MKRKTNLSLDPSIYELARRIMELRTFTDFSDFIETLVREEWERRHGPVRFPQSEQDLQIVAERPPPYKIAKKKSG